MNRGWPAGGPSRETYPRHAGHHSHGRRQGHMSLRRCAWHNCPQLVKQGTRFCAIHTHTHTSGSVAARQQEDTTQHTATSAGHGRHDWPQAKHTPAPNADSQSQPQTNGTSATQTTDKAGQGQNIAAATGKTANTKQPQASNTGRDTKPSHSSNHSRSQQANRKHKHDTTQHKRTKRKRTSQTSTRNKNNKTHTKQEKIRLTNPPTPLGGYPERQGQDRR